ncbi:hypothetical protein HPP92_023324 [Vanilla planifolia]|uniref:Protein kinase domain-containing protein n=1 Tax=Vanilla planifolia TaxID=51239 RepID=A0A835UE12_VANPL|nr:hypothetical protein HPP92_023324 [Vanilla planifolia]
MRHRSRGSGRTPLDWDHRMRIAFAAGRGLATPANGIAGCPQTSRPRTSSSGQTRTPPALSDYGLAPLRTQRHAGQCSGGYRAPEVVETRRATFKSDVFSFGVLLLELLTERHQTRLDIRRGGYRPAALGAVGCEEMDHRSVRRGADEVRQHRGRRWYGCCRSPWPASLWCRTRGRTWPVVRMMEDVASNRGAASRGRRRVANLLRRSQADLRRP